VTIDALTALVDRDARPSESLWDGSSLWSISSPSRAQTMVQSRAAATSEPHHLHHMLLRVLAGTRVLNTPNHPAGLARKGFAPITYRDRSAPGLRQPQAGRDLPQA
jgi:hypothetical protein